MGDTLADGLQNLNIGDQADTANPNRCLFLEMLPAELRVEIYELALRQDPPIIVVDLRKQPQHEQQQQSNVRPPDALTLTNTQIHHETSQIRYRVNAVHIFAPIFSPDAFTSQFEHRGIIISRLNNLVDLQSRTKQFTNLKILLGRMPPLSRIHWIDFFSRWNSVVPALKGLRDGVGGEVRVSFEFRRGVTGDEALRFSFGLGGRGDVERGLEVGEGVMVGGGGRVELTEREGERLGKIRGTIVKTLFDGFGNGT